MIDDDENLEHPPEHPFWPAPWVEAWEDAVFVGRARDFSGHTAALFESAEVSRLLCLDLAIEERSTTDRFIPAPAVGVLEDALVPGTPGTLRYLRFSGVPRRPGPLRLNRGTFFAFTPSTSSALPLRVLAADATASPEERVPRTVP